MTWNLPPMYIQIYLKKMSEIKIILPILYIYIHRYPWRKHYIHLIIIPRYSTFQYGYWIAAHVYIYIHSYSSLCLCIYMTCTCESHISFVALASRINAGPKIPKILGLCPSKTGSTRPFFWVNLQAQKPSWLVVEPPILPKICAENHWKSSSKQGISGDSIKTSSDM